MAELTRELALTVRWPNHAEDRKVLASPGTAIPFETDTVVGGQEVKAGSLYELEMLVGVNRILHVSGAVPPAKDMKDGQTVLVADAWVRCRVTQDAELQYEIHLGPAGMDQPKACHKGRMVLNR